MWCSICRQIKKAEIAPDQLRQSNYITGVVNVAIIKEDIAEMKAEISLVENMIYVVKDGQVHPIAPPTSGHGEQSFLYKSGKVTRMDERKTQLI